MKIENKEENKIVDITKYKDEKLLLKILINFMKIVLCMVLLFLFIASFTHTAYFYTDKIDYYHEGLYYKLDNLFINFIGILMIFSIIALINKLINKIKIRNILIVVLLLILTISIIWNIFVKAPLKSDQAQVIGDASLFAKGDFSSLSNYSYLYCHPLQLGIVVFEAIIIKIFNTNLSLVFQVLNAICMAISVFMIYKIVNNIYNENISKIMLILIIFIGIIPFYTVVVYGNIVGLMFILIALLFFTKYLKNKKIRNLLFTILFSIISILLKSNYEIVIIAIMIILFLDLIKKNNVKDFIFLISLILVTVFSYKMLYVVIENITGYKVNEGVPMITYIAMSINQKPISRNSGWYGEDTTIETIYAASNYNFQDTSNVSMMIIKDRLNYFISNPIIALKFYQDKICSTWIEPTFQTLWWAEPLEAYPGTSDEYKEFVNSNDLYQSIMVGSLHNILIRYLDFIENIVFFMALISIIYSLKNKDYQIERYVFPISFLGGFFFHILWETKCIYVIPFYLLLIPNASYGISIIIDFIRNKYKKR